MHSSHPPITRLESAYETLAARFPGGMCSRRPVIVIQAGGRRTLRGWHALEVWQNREQALDEISLCAEDLARSVEEISETLLHEMVHHYNACRGVRDCSASQYHNAAFKRIAAAVEVRRMG